MTVITVVGARLMGSARQAALSSGGPDKSEPQRLWAQNGSHLCFYGSSASV